MTNKRLNVFFSLLLLLGVSIVGAIPENEIIPFNIPFVMGASADGSVVAGLTGSGQGAFFWTEDTGVVSLGEGDANAVSDNYLTVGTSRISDDTGTRNVAGYWDLEGNFTEIGGLEGYEPQADGSFSDGYAISADGSVIAGMGWTGGWTANAFKWSEETGMINLDSVSDASRVNSLSADGTMAAGFTTDEFGMRMAVYWDSDNLAHILPNLGDSEVIGVSRNGELMVGHSDGQAFIHSAEGINFFGSTEPGWNTVPNHVNNNGLVVGVERDWFTNFQGGIIYNETMGTVSADEYFTQRGVVLPEGYSVSAVSWVSEDGRTFVGWGGPDSVGFIVKLSESAFITGNVTAENDGDVTLATITNGEESVNPAADGSYSLTVSPGSHNLTISMPGYYTQMSDEIVLEAGDTIADVDFDLEVISNAATIQGTVTLNGGTGNITQTVIQAGDFTTSPDSNGFYSIAVSAGNYILSFELNGYFDLEEDVTITTAEVLDVDVELYSIETLNSLVINIAGDADIDMENTRIYVDHHTPGGNYFTPEEDGTLYLGILYEPNLTISVYAPGFLPVAVGGIETSPYEEVTVDFFLEKVYNSPRNLTMNDSGVLEWDAAYAINSYFDDFDSYPTGAGISLNNPMWLPIGDAPGSTVDPIVAVNTNIHDSKYLEVNSDSDAIVNVGNVLDMEDNLTTGKYEVNFDIMIPSGFAGHYNIIRSLQDLEFSLEVFFREDGTLQVHHSNTVTSGLTFNHDEWIEVKHLVNLTNDAATLHINGEEIASWQFSANAFGEGTGVNQFDLINFSGDSEPTAEEISLFYVDNFAFSDVDAFSADGYLVYRDNMLLTTAPLSVLTYTDVDVLEEGTYTYGVSAVYNTFETDQIEIVVDLEATSNDNNDVSLVTALRDNYPNPFNPETTISFSIASDEFVSIEIYNLKGQKVKTLVRETLTKGNHDVVWKGLDKKGNKVNSGLYFYRMKVGNSTTTKKMTLMK